MLVSKRSFNMKDYNGDIIAGSLLVPESRKIARLFIENSDQNGWYQAIVIDNVLQKRNPASAKRQAKLIRNRLELMTLDFWKLIESGSSDIVVQALLAATIKQCHLLGDFMNGVIKDNWNSFNKYITHKDWDDFIEICMQIDPKIEKWTVSTKNKLKQVVLRILAESKYIDGVRSLRLQPVSIAPEILNYLKKNNEDYVLRCMDITG